MAQSHKVRLFSVPILEEVMEQLNDPRAVLTIQVSDGYSERVIYFAAGGVRLLSVGERGTTDIPSYLLDSGRINVEQLHEVLEKVRSGETDLRGALDQCKVLTAEEFKKISVKFIRDEIFDLVFWQDTYFKTYPTAPPSTLFSKDRPALTGNLDYIDLAEDVTRWIEAWPRYRKLLRSDEATLNLTSRGRRALKHEAFEGKDALESCAEGLTLRALRRRVDMELPELCARFAEFAEKKWVNVSTVRAASRTQRLEDSIAALEEALPRVIDRELVQEKLAHLYNKARNKGKASEQMIQLAKEALAREDWDAAQELWEKLVSMRELHSEAFVTYVKAYLKRDESDVSRLAMTYANALEEGGIQKPEEELGRLLRRIPRAKLPKLEFEAAWAKSKGNAKKSAELYEKVSQAYLSLGDAERAIRALEQAFACDPDNAAIMTSLAQLQRAYEGSSTWKKRREANTRVRLNPALVVTFVAILVTAWLHWSGYLYKILPRVPALATSGAEADGEDDDAAPEPTENLKGVGQVPLEGRKGLDPRQAFEIDEASGVVKTPLGEVPLLGGSEGASPLRLDDHGDGSFDHRGSPDGGFGDGDDRAFASGFTAVEGVSQEYLDSIGREPAPAPSRA